MHLTTTPTSQEKPCIRDYSELITKEVPEELAKLVPLPELKRRLDELDRTKPKYRQETPLYYRIEEKRRALLAGPHLR